MLQQVKFIHLRVFEYVGHMDEVGPIAHEYKISPRGGITIAYQEKEDGFIDFSFARCHPRDAYNKKQGRAKSAGRLCSPQWTFKFKAEGEEHGGLRLTDQIVDKVVEVVPDAAFMI